MSRTPACCTARSWEPALWETTFNRLVGFAIRRGASHADAHDFAQDTVVKLLEGRFDPARGELWPWLHRVVYNAVVTVCRKRRLEPLGDDPAEDADDPGRDLEAAEWFDRVAADARLSPIERAVARAWFEGENPVAALADTHDRGQAYKAAERARRKLGPVLAARAAAGVGV